MFDMSIATNNNTIRASLILDRLFFEPSLYEYAFYLCRDIGYKEREVIKRVPYSKQTNVNFDSSDLVGEFYIRYFIRDTRDLTKKAFSSEKFIVN
ncbi:hypothetical protein [Psychrobacter celer]|uniref:hypothetical protein n=1 Tax=Psychrobacter celer TaxID=306572 RepID=UPI003FD0A5E6